MCKRKKISDIKHIGFISNRFSGTDDVSLETAKQENREQRTPDPLVSSSHYF